MPNYKDTENKLHWLDDESHEYLLPAGSVKITEKQAAKLQEESMPLMVEAPQIDPVDKLKEFLSSNPDVAELLK